MNIEIVAASITDKPLIRQMMELYQYDFSEFANTDLDEHGYFGYSYLDHYWVEFNRYPFLVRVDSKLAGFVLVHQNTYFPNSQYLLSEFFILRKYRQKGIGRKVAFNILDRYCGSWEIYQAHTNPIAKKFWKSIIETYTNNKYTEIVMEDDGWAGIMRCFDNSNNF